jgi:hypothetical protein
VFALCNMSVKDSVLHCVICLLRTQCVCTVICLSRMQCVALCNISVKDTVCCTV